MSDWPDGFIWGTAASSTQTEGASPGSDWMAWEERGKAPRSGDGNGFATRHAEDFQLYAENGLTHHRLGLDWNRLEPKQGHHPEEEIERYRAMLQAGRAQCLGNKAMLVHGHATQAAAHAVGQGDDAWVAERFAQHHIVALRQAADGHQ